MHGGHVRVDDDCCGFFSNVPLSPLCQLEQVCLDESISPREVPASDSQRQNIHAILEPLERSGQVDQLAPALTALNLIVSAVDGKKTL